MSDSLHGQNVSDDEPAVTILWQDENDCWHQMGMWKEEDREHAHRAFDSFSLGGRVVRKVLANLRIVGSQP